MQIKRSTLVRVFAGGCVSLSAGAFAANTDYVAAAVADVAEFESGAFKAPAQSAWIGGGHQNDGTASLAAFEKFLKENLRGTHILYLGLAEAQKVAVWENYVKTGDLGGIRSDIFAFRKVKTRQPARSSINNVPMD